MKKLISLGYPVAVLNLPVITERDFSTPELVIMEASVEQENSYSPAASIRITGIKNIQILRDFLNESLKEIPNV